jgi:hypothetical protein
MAPEQASQPATAGLPEPVAEAAEMPASAPASLVEKARPLVDSTQRGARRLNRLVEDLPGSSRIHEGKLELRPASKCRAAQGLAWGWDCTSARPSSSATAVR